MSVSPSRTLLVMALAVAWPVAPVWAGTHSRASLAVEDQQFGEETPLRLTMSLAMTVPGSHRPTPAPDAPGSAPQVAQLLRDPRSAVATPLKLERVLALRPQVPPDLTRLAADRLLPAADSRLGSDVLSRALAVMEGGNRSSGNGPADSIVDGEFNRALMQYVRLQMPTLPAWQPPRPNAPVQPVVSPEIVPLPEAAERPQRAGPTTKPNVKAKRDGGLRGRAWRLSDQGYKAYARGDYQTALERADAALQLQPDAVRLYQLRVYALQMLGRLEDAARAAEEAIAKGYTSPELQAALTNLRPAPGAAGVPNTPEYRKAFPIATLAFEQIAAGRFAEAASNAEIAVRTDPSQGDWALLWLNALEDLQRYEEIIVAGKQAIELGAPNRDAIGALMRLASQAIAVQHAEKAYELMGKNRPLDAVPQAREAVRRAPDVASHHLLLISALQAAQDTAGAEVAATQALALDDENTTIRLQRAFLRQQLRQGESAQQDIDAVLAEDWTDEALRRDARLIGADLALANGDPQRVTELLKPLPAGDGQADARRKAAEGIASWFKSAEALPVTAYAPLQLCRDTPYGTVCEMHPWDAPGTDNPAARAYAAYGQKRFAEAIVLARRALAEDPQNAGNEALLTTALASGTPAEQQEALARLDQAIAVQSGDANLLRQRGYLHLSNSRPALALEDFVAARNTGNAPSTNLLDEAYAMAATGRKTVAAAMLRQAIDNADEGKMPLDAQQRFDTRSAIANLSREWGVMASVGYRGARAPSNGLVGQPVALPGNAVFSTVEAYWRPPEFLNSSTSTFDVYGRLSNTLHSGTDVTGAQLVPDPCGGGTLAVAETRTQAVSGFPTTTGTLGVRYTPWTEKNLTFGLERQFYLGNSTRNGSLNPSSNAIRCLLNQSASAVEYRTDSGAGAWQAYALYGFYEGTGLRLDAKSWFTMEGYLQAGYTLLDAPTAYTLRDSSGQVLGSSDGKLKRGQGFAAGEVRIGRSFLTDYNERLVFFPHVSLAADWYSDRNRVSGSPVPGNASFDLTGNDRSWSLGAGVGVNVRYWLQGDHYRAQRSYVDGSLQYRTRLGGVADRAKGIFLNLSYSY